MSRVMVGLRFLGSVGDGEVSVSRRIDRHLDGADLEVEVRPLHVGSVGVEVVPGLWPRDVADCIARSGPGVGVLPAGALVARRGIGTRRTPRWAAVRDGLRRVRRRPAVASGCGGIQKATRGAPRSGRRTSARRGPRNSQERAQNHDALGPAPHSPRTSTRSRRGFQKGARCSDIDSTAILTRCSLHLGDEEESLP